MKQNKLVILALLGMMSQASATKTTDDLQKMYTDPEYADTWRFTDEARYIDSQDLNEWEKSAPKAYSFLETQESKRNPQNYVQSQSKSMHGDWNQDDLRSMGLPGVYKKNAPHGYKEGIAYQGGDEKVNTKEDKQAFTDSLGGRAAELADKSTHDRMTYPNLRPEVQENEDEVTYGNSLLARAAKGSVSDKQNLDHDHQIVMGGKVGFEANREAFQKLNNIQNALKPKTVQNKPQQPNILETFPENDEEARIAIGGKLGWKALRQERDELGEIKRLNAELNMRAQRNNQYANTEPQQVMSHPSLSQIRSTHKKKHHRRHHNNQNHHHSFYPAGTNSEIVEGDGFREHAWNNEQAKQSAADKYVKDAPDGYTSFAFKMSKNQY